MLQMIERGILWRIKHLYGPKIELGCRKRNLVEDTKFEPVQISHLGTYFIAFVISLVICFSFFGVEVLINYIFDSG